MERNAGSTVEHVTYFFVGDLVFDDDTFKKFVNLWQYWQGHQSL